MAGLNRQGDRWWKRVRSALGLDTVAEREITAETVTVLHAGTRSFTALTEKDPRSAMAELIRIEELVGHAVREHGGRMIQVFNGEAFAAFGTAPAALRAAQAICERAGSGEREGPRIMPACGIHAGPVYVHRGSYYGSSINTAAIVSAIGQRGGADIVVSATAASLVSGHLPEGRRLARLEQARVKGMAEPLELFALTRADAASAGAAVFISYRREGGAETARLVCADLQGRGVRTFLDLDDLRSHHFDERLYREIEAAPNFVLILSPGCLDRCGDEHDWLRREIAHAIRTGRNIVPVLKDEFAFPPKGELPADLADLPRYNCVRYSHEYFRSTMDRVASFLVTETLVSS